MKRHLKPVAYLIAAVAFSAVAAIAAHLSDAANAQPRGNLPPANAAAAGAADAGNTPKWTVRLFAGDRAVCSWDTDAVEYLGHGVFMFRDALTKRDVQVAGSLVVEANW